MRFMLLGKSGLRVSELCLGTMTFGEEWGWGASKDGSRRIFDTFASAGGNFIDTANNYTEGTSERFIGEFISADRDHFVLATKFSLSMRKDDPNAGGNHRKNIVQALEASLRRLRTDRVDLYWPHMWDFLTPVEEVVRALDDLVRAGKVLYVGFSDTPAWVVAQAVTLADLRGWARCVAVQVPYSLAHRDPEREFLPMARALDLAVTAWAPLEGGELTGKYNRDTGEAARYQRSSIRPARLALAEHITAVAAELGRTPAQVALNWVRAQQRRAVVIPIVGARTEAQMRNNLGCLEFTLGDEVLARLEAPAKVELGFPHTFLASDHVQELIFGTTRPLIDAHR